MKKKPNYKKLLEEEVTKNRMLKEQMLEVAKILRKIARGEKLR